MIYLGANATETTAKPYYENKVVIALMLIVTGILGSHVIEFVLEEFDYRAKKRRSKIRRILKKSKKRKSK